jgi:hypothetical protein
MGKWEMRLVMRDDSPSESILWRLSTELLQIDGIVKKIIFSECNNRICNILSLKSFRKLFLKIKTLILFLENPRSNGTSLPKKRHENEKISFLKK